MVIDELMNVGIHRYNVLYIYIYINSLSETNIETELEKFGVGSRGGQVVCTANG